MLKRLSIVAALTAQFVLTPPALTAAAPRNLPGLLQNARLLLDQPVKDSLTLAALAHDIEAEIARGNPDDWTDSACVTLTAIVKELGDPRKPNAWALQFCLNHRASPCLEQALREVWPVNAEPAAQLEVADLLLGQAELEPEQPWSKLFLAALFRAYAQEAWWTPASYLGDRLLSRAFEFAHAERMTLANAYLRSGREDDARALLRAMTVQTRKESAEVVRAAVELGLIEQVYQREAQAQAQFELAWTSWTRSRQRPEYAESSVSRAAARARWELWQIELSALDKKLAGAADWNEKDLRRLSRDFERGGEELLSADPAYRNAVDYTLGVAHRLWGDGWLRLGRQVARTDSKTKSALLARALDSYRTAEEFQVHCAQAAPQQIEPLLAGHWAQIPNNFQLQARQARYDLLVHAAEQLQTWSAELWRDVPLQALGEQGSLARFDALANEGLPALKLSVDFRDRARRYALSNRELRNSRLDPESVWQGVAPALKQLHQICATQWKTTSATATQIERTLSATSNPAAAASLRDALSAQLAIARSYGQESLAALDDVFTLLLAAVPERESLRTLAHERLALSRDYAAMDRVVHEALMKATGALSRKDPDSARLKTVLEKERQTALEREVKTLESGWEWASRNGFVGPVSDGLYTRLSEREPLRYPLSTPGAAAATR